MLRLWSALLLLATTASLNAEGWSRFRGPNGSGIVEDGHYPDRLDRAAQAWRAPVRPGKSSPVLTDEHVVLTAFEGDLLFTQCFARETGELLWERSQSRPREAQINRLNEPAAITPATDGENVYVLFRDVGLVSYSAAGEVRWKAPLDPFHNIMGHTTSPIFAGGLLIVQADQSYDSYLAAFDPGDGEVRWRIDRDEGESWTTPLVYRHEGGDVRIFLASRGWASGHRASDGARLWGVTGLPPALVASPTLAGDTVYSFGYGNAADSEFAARFNRADADTDGRLTADEYEDNVLLMGVARYHGNRDGVLDRDEYDEWAQATVAPSSLVALRFDAGAGPPKQLWRYERAFNHVVPSPLVYRGLVYVIKNGGILETIDAETGESLKTGRVRQALGGYSASPVAADGKIYLASEEGKVTVLRAGAQHEAVSTSDLEEPIFATPALSRGRVFIRTDDALYAFGN